MEQRQIDPTILKDIDIDWQEHFNSNIQSETSGERDVVKKTNVTKSKEDQFVFGNERDSRQRRINWIILYIYIYINICIN